MYKKIFLVLVISLVFIGSFAGWATAGSTGPVTIDFLNFSSSGDNAIYLEEMKKVFEEQNPDIKINIETVGFGDYFTLLQTRVAGGTAPDAYELNFENFVTYAKKGVLLDLEPLFVKNKFDTSVLDKNALTAFSLEGKQYGLPAMFSDVVLFYNKDLFDNEAHLTQQLIGPGMMSKKLQKR